MRLSGGRTRHFQYYVLIIGPLAQTRTDLVCLFCFWMLNFPIDGLVWLFIGSGYFRRVLLIHFPVKYLREVSKDPNGSIVDFTNTWMFSVWNSWKSALTADFSCRRHLSEIGIGALEKYFALSSLPFSFTVSLGFCGSIFEIMRRTTCKKFCE